MPVTITEAHIREALNLPDFDAAAAWQPMRMRPNLRRDTPPAGANTRKAGVLVLLYPAHGTLTTLLMRRTPDPGIHSGQIGFPGGSWEPGDPDYRATALREACEEVGVCREDVSILGQLTPVYIPPSGFLVWPTVGILPVKPVLRPNPEEVAELLELPLPTLLDPATKLETTMTIAGITFTVPYYDVQGQVVWGATALMLCEFEARLRVAMTADC